MTGKKTLVQGEMVTVTIKSAQVQLLSDRSVTLQLPGASTCQLPLVDGIQIDRVAPADWPPVAADVWADRHGRRWLATTVDQTDYAEPGDLLMVCAEGRAGTRAFVTEIASAMLDQYGPVRLLYRNRDVQPASTEPTPVWPDWSVPAGYRGCAHPEELGPGAEHDHDTCCIASVLAETGMPPEGMIWRCVVIASEESDHAYVLVRQADNHGIRLANRPIIDREWVTSHAVAVVERTPNGGPFELQINLPTATQKSANYTEEAAAIAVANRIIGSRP